MGKPVKPKRKVVLNPLSGRFDLVSDNNFSYESVPDNKKLTIQENHQMVVYEGLDVDGELDLYGSVILEE
jgi:hypothetical protein